METEAEVTIWRPLQITRYCWDAIVLQPWFALY